MSEHDPFNEPDQAHPRARELMVEPFFWDCVDERAPFGSDEGSDAYYEWRSWRADNPSAPLVQCIAWILDGHLDGYNGSLCTDEQIEQDLANPEDAFLSELYDMFTLDTTIIATALGQLLDEGKIESDAKPFVDVAIHRQLHPSVGEYEKDVLKAVQRVVNAATT
ncbi:MAG: molybdate metabolism regulator [Pirellulales bacterium]|nr:molybdate metabolism regulator [Pirellulales bacterium]